ncbi:MAG: DUF3800 domain-containing protein [Gemmatimonadales bacterium]
MHLLYLDDSGDDGRSPNSSGHFVLGGLTISDREWRPLVARVDAIVTKHLGAAGAKTELHGSDILSGRHVYRAMDPAKREALFRDVLTEVGRKESRLSLFFVVVHKESLPVTRGVRVVALLQLCQRFNSYLTRIGAYSKRAHSPGMLICDEHTAKGQIQSLMAVIHSGGLPKQLRDNLIETAFFTESHESRVLQVADMLCHTVYRFVTERDERFFHLVESKIDRDTEPGTKKLVHYGFRYIAKSPETGLVGPLPFKVLHPTATTRLPQGSFLKVDDLERELAAHGL